MWGHFDMNILIDHYKNPRHKGVITGPDLAHEVINRKCGDKLSFTARISGDMLQEISHMGEGCFYCRVSASIACRNIQGRPINDLKMEIALIRSWLRDQSGPEPANPDIRALGEIKKFPMRIDCVDLAWKGLEEMLR